MEPLRILFEIILINIGAFTLVKWICLKTKWKDEEYWDKTFAGVKNIFFLSWIIIPPILLLILGMVVIR